MASSDFSNLFYHMAGFMEEYKYRVSDFEGPLDLLLYLIEKNKVDIYNIPIVAITDQFNQYVAQLHHFDVNYASKFFVMAATLLQIKSRLLLPKPSLPETEEEDPKDELVRQLLEYKQMKRISTVIAALQEQRGRMLDRERTPIPYEAKFSGTIDKDDLYDAFRLVYQSLDKEPDIEIHITKEIYSIDTCMARLDALLRSHSGPVAVLTVFRQCRSRTELVITFVAILELLKQGQCRTVSDGEDGNTIAIRRAVPEAG